MRDNNYLFVVLICLTCTLAALQDSPYRRPNKQFHGEALESRGGGRRNIMGALRRGRGGRTCACPGPGPVSCGRGRKPGLPLFMTSQGAGCLHVVWTETFPHEVTLYRREELPIELVPAAITNRTRGTEDREPNDSPPLPTNSSRASTTCAQSRITRTQICLMLRVQSGMRAERVSDVFLSFSFLC